MDVLVHGGAHGGWCYQRVARILRSATLTTRDREQMEKARVDGRLWTINTGHDLMLTEPQAVADALLEIEAA